MITRDDLEIVPALLGEFAPKVADAAGVGRSVEVTTHSGTALFPSIQILVEADFRGWLPVMGVNLSEEQISQILHEAETALGTYATRDGQVRFDVSAHIVTGKTS